METAEPNKIHVEETMRAVREMAVHRAAGNIAVGEEIQASGIFDEAWERNVTDYGQ